VQQVASGAYNFLVLVADFLVLVAGWAAASSAELLCLYVRQPRFGAEAHPCSILAARATRMQVASFQAMLAVPSEQPCFWHLLPGS